MLELKGLPSDNQQTAHAYIAQSNDALKLLSQVTMLAKSLLCEQPIGFESCGRCHSCELNQSQTHPDLIQITHDKSSIGIDEIRVISETLSKTPQIAGKQVVIIPNAGI